MTHSKANEFPVYMMVEDVLVPIGMIDASSFSPGHIQLMGELDAFPGARLTFSRVVNWEEFLAYVQALYPDKLMLATENRPTPPTEGV